MPFDKRMKCSAEGGILFNCFVAQSVEATTVRRNDFEQSDKAGIQKKKKKR
jgi:hypothetical protein